MSKKRLSVKASGTMFEVQEHVGKPIKLTNDVRWGRISKIDKGNITIEYPDGSKEIYIT